MNINEMSEHEKSAVLARLIGCTYEHDGITGEWWLDGIKFYDEWEVNYSLNLYAEDNMALLAHVLAWLWEDENWPAADEHTPNEYWYRWTGYADHAFSFRDLHGLMVDCADYALELVIKAGMVK